MIINRSDKPDLSLIGKWLRTELNNDPAFRSWGIRKSLQEILKQK